MVHNGTVTIRHDVGAVSRTEPTPQGGLRVHAHVTRTGVFEYMRVDGSVRREYRPADEVFHQDSLASLEDAPFTIEHPAGLLAPTSYGAHAAGHVRDPRQDGDRVAAVVVIQSAQGLGAVRSGLREVSCGYSCRIDETPGVTPEGERYDAIQRDIRYNHVSLVPRGRAGASVRLRLDSNNDTSLSNGDFMIRIDGVDYPLDTDADRKAAAAAMVRYQAKCDAALAAEKTRADAATAALGAEKTRADALEHAEKQRADAAVKATCLRVLGKEGTPADVIAKVLPSIKLDGKGPEYATAMLDAAVAHFDSLPKDPDGLAGVRQSTAPVAAPRNDASERVTADSLRAKMIADGRAAWTQPLAMTKDGAK